MMAGVETLWGAHALAYALAAAAHAAWGWRSGRAAWWAGAPRAAVAPGSAACAAANLWISYQMEAWARPRAAWPWADFSVWRVGLQLAAYVFFADVWFYYAHRALHANASLYRQIDNRVFLCFHLPRQCCPNTDKINISYFFRDIA